jgi:hypothetical protein
MAKSLKITSGSSISMPDPVTGIIGAAVVGGGILQATSAESAADAQIEGSRAGIGEQRAARAEVAALLEPYRQVGFPALQGLQPYAQAGAPALQRQQALAGLLGPQAQQQAISQIEGSPIFQAQVRTGEEALLQNASATGGLRGGNVQAALAQFRPAMLNAEIERNYGRLGGFTALGVGTQQNLAQLGQASAAGTAAATMAAGQNIANLQGNVGAAEAGGILGQARGFGQILNAPVGMLGMEYGLRASGYRGQTPFGGAFGF